MPYPYNILRHTRLGELLDLRGRLLEEAEHFRKKHDVRDMKLYRVMEIDQEIIRRDWPRYKEDDSLYDEEVKELYRKLL